MTRSLTFLCTLLALSTQAALAPVNLRCGMRINPLGIGDAAPRLSWQLSGDPQARGEVQTAYQTLIGSAPGAADLWDSGKINSYQMNSITGIVVHSDIPRASSFACSSLLLNQLLRNIIWSQKGNYLEAPTDCAVFNLGSGTYQ